MGGADCNAFLCHFVAGSSTSEPMITQNWLIYLDSLIIFLHEGITH